MADVAYTELIPEDTTPEAIEDSIYAQIQVQFPDWEPSEAQLDVWIIKGLALIQSQAYEVMTDVAAEIFAYFGESIMGLPRVEASAATAVSTWTLSDDLGHTIPANTMVSIPSGNSSVAFTTNVDVVVDSGDDTASVTLVAQDPGTVANSLGGNPTLIDGLAFVESITLDNPTAGGVDAETMDQYLPRLKELLQLMSPRPVVPRDFEVLARNYGAYRAVAIEGLDPGDSSTDNPLMLTLAVMNALGEPLDAGTVTTFGTKAYIEAQIEAQLMANSVIHIIDPTYTTIDVTAAVATLPQFDHASVVAAVEAALIRYLAPINWGRRPGYGEVPAQWFNTPIVRYTELISVVDAVPGVDYVDSLTFKKTGGSLATTNVSLTGFVPLTEPGTLTIT